MTMNHGRTSKCGHDNDLKVSATYRKENGATWSGRGLKPKWLSEKVAAGGKIEDFAV